MSRDTRYVPKLDDGEVSRAFAAIASRFSGQGATVLESYSRLEGHPLAVARLKVGDGSWTWTRLHVEHNDPNSTGFDTLSFSWNQQAGQRKDALIAEITSTLGRFFASNALAASDDAPEACDPLPAQLAFA